MKNRNDERMHMLLRQALPPIAEAEPRCDLWPAMQSRLRVQPARLSRLDLALACGVAAFALLFPPAIPILLYCL